MNRTQRKDSYDIGRIDQSLTDLRTDTQQILTEIKELRGFETTSTADRAAIRKDLEGLKSDLKDHKDSGTRQTGWLLTVCVIVVAFAELIIHVVEAKFFP